MELIPYLIGKARRAGVRLLLALVLSLTPVGGGVLAQVLGDPVDVSQEFQKMEQVYFVGSRVRSFDPATGAFVGTIEVNPGNGQTPGGLWALDFGIGGMNGSPDTLYFTDGIDGETHGLFAAITPVPEPSTLALLGASLLSFCVFRRRRSPRT